MRKSNGLFGFKGGTGVKYGTAWKGKSYNTKTREYYGAYVTIRDNFRAYDTVEESVEDYMDRLCSLFRYKGAVNQEDANTCITAIKNDGYATSPTYITTIMNIIRVHDLMQYDITVTGNTTVLLRLLKSGSRGKDVKQLQQVLNDHNYPCGNVDGIFGVKTPEAVKAFQADKNLIVNGIVGFKTWEKIL